MKSTVLVLLFLNLFFHTQGLLPPKFQWKTIDFAWEGNRREAALASGDYIPENNMPAGIARWRDKVFITIPRWKKGVPSSLNYVYLNGSQSQPLNPYPSWNDGFVSEKSHKVTTNSTVVSAFRIYIDKCDRLWAVDNGVADMSRELRQITEPAIVIFDLRKNVLIHRYVIDDEVLRDSTVLTSIVVDVAGKGCEDTFAYIPDMGSNALLVYSLRLKDVWRIENHFFHFDPHEGVYRVGGVDFYWSDGISSAVVIPAKKGSGAPYLYFHPTSSRKLFRMSTKLLRDRNVPLENIFAGVEIVGDRGEKSQATAIDFDHNNNVLFSTQLSKNGVSCWNVDQPLTPEKVPLIISDCTVLEFPNDIKVDHDSNLWILSNRQSRFLYESMDFEQINFRVLTAPTTTIIQGTACEKISSLDRVLSFIKKKDK
ncbi:unnamed protein product [Danaus chrysippus]|uniref:(African queen) hypothetical protein n=1 Tax=Danaus chrysippus TaxID=151541 RepID=A0A8J2QMP1_9NEOP|nr:unnamed protein product [Danaus chrysippus]